MTVYNDSVCLIDKRSQYGGYCSKTEKRVLDPERRKIFHETVWQCNSIEVIFINNIKNRFYLILKISFDDIIFRLMAKCTDKNVQLTSHGSMERHSAVMMLIFVVASSII